jgi:guanine deaminase
MAAAAERLAKEEKTMSYNPDFMLRAIELSKEALSKPGTEPFGGVVVLDGKIVGEGLNHSLAHFDPTSHGETEAIRDACRNLKRVDLAGAEMYASCEPCAMCVAAMEIAGFSRLYYAASMDQAGGAFRNLSKSARHPIDVGRLRKVAGSLVADREVPAEQHMGNEATDILVAWADMKKEG